MRIIAVRKAEEKKMLMQRMEEYKKKKCKTGQHEKMAIFNESNPESYRSIYGLLFSEFGEEITRQIHDIYMGRQISFPKKLYTEEYINHYIQNNREKKTTAMMAAELECTERSIRQRMKSTVDAEQKENILKYRPVYNELYLKFWEKVMRRIYDLYMGHQISFPKKLYTENYIRHYVKEHMWDMIGSELAKELGYTERRISQLIKSITEQAGEKAGDGA